MQPLIGQSRPDAYNNRSSFSSRTKQWRGKAILYAIGVIVFVVALVAFLHPSSLNPKSKSQQVHPRSFLTTMDKPDNALAYPSNIQWRDPSRKLPPKPGAIPGQMPGVPAAPEEDPAATYGTGAGMGTLPAWEDPNAWKAPPTGTDGAEVNGVTYGGTDITSIADSAERAAAEAAMAEAEEEYMTEEVRGKDPAYPTTVDVPERIIIPSDPEAASDYYKAVGSDDVIWSMPYLEVSTCSESPTNCAFKQYSGYLLANKQAEIHYWFIEAEVDPVNKPIFIWTNGGPGCSGMDGLLTEHGPWRVNDNLKIEYNKYSWNTEVNMVYLEQPYGVGFSALEVEDSEVAGDQNAADDLDAAIRNWLTKFPDYADNDLYLSSESWGGHYVPITTYTILENNKAKVEPHINFKGFFLGNPYTDFYENAYGFVGGVHGHGMMKAADWDYWRAKCWGNKEAIDTSAQCSAIYSRAYVSAYNANVYALDYPQCYDDEDWEETLIDRPNPEFWRFYNYKDAHIHHAARGFMEVVLAHHNYDSLKMGMEKSELQLLHDKIALQLAMEADDTLAPPPPQGASGAQGVAGAQPVQGMPPQGGAAQGMPQGMPQGGAAQGMPQQGAAQGMPQGGAAQGMPQQGAQAGQAGQALRNRPNHNLGNRMPQSGGQSQAERDLERARQQEAAQAAQQQADENIQEYGDGYLPCIEYDMADYLNLDVVQKAINVKPTKWELCSNTVWNAWPESDYDTQVEAYYAEIIEKYLIEEGLTLAVYSGDDDSVCGIEGTTYWLDRWQYKVNAEVDWQAWQDDDTQLGGFYSQYMTLDEQNVALHFLSVRTAGHMVPTTQPARALTILKKFLYEFQSVKDDAEEEGEEGEEQQDDDEEQTEGDDETAEEDQDQDDEEDEENEEDQDETGDDEELDDVPGSKKGKKESKSKKNKRKQD